CTISKKQDWIDLYAKPFFFGCEADDRATAWAFSKNNPFGTKLNALYSSDIGHFDVIDMRHPLPEAYELVEDGCITEDNFRDFVFANTVHLWGTQNPKFFEGTTVAKAAGAARARGQRFGAVSYRPAPGALRPARRERDLRASARASPSCPNVTSTRLSFCLPSMMMAMPWDTRIERRLADYPALRAVGQ